MVTLEELQDFETHELLTLAGQAIEDQGINLENVGNASVVSIDGPNCDVEINYFDYTTDTVTIAVSDILGE